MNETNRIFVEAEARRICDREGVTTMETFQNVARGVAHRRFMEAVAPFVKQKAHYHALRMLDRIVLKADGSFERVEYRPLPPEVEKCIAMLDEMIVEEGTRWGFDIPVANSPSPAT